MAEGRAAGMAPREPFPRASGAAAPAIPAKAGSHFFFCPSRPKAAGFQPSRN